MSPPVRNRNELSSQVNSTALHPSLRVMAQKVTTPTTGKRAKRTISMGSSGASCRVTTVRKSQSPAPHQAYEPGCGFPRCGLPSCKFTRDCHSCVVHINRGGPGQIRSEEHTSELQSLRHLVCRLLLE